MNNGACVGLIYAKGGQDFQEHGPVIFASGGFGADFTQTSLLAQYRPDLMHLPTTNGEHCTGDGVKMGEAIGAKSVDLEWVQVHPTGLVKPDDPDAKIKFLAAEALRGVGGIVIDRNGKRFANELGRRDYVTGEMWKSQPPFRLCLNKAASDEIIWHMAPPSWCFSHPERAIKRILFKNFNRSPLGSSREINRFSDRCEARKKEIQGEVRNTK
jgi:succinate dehydrogenase/fumarate reductase flavoprotein subunit